MRLHHEGLGTDSKSAARPLFVHPLPEPGPEWWRQVEIARLIDFFSHPIRFLLRERLSAVEAELPDQEPFRLGRQEAFRLAERLLPLCLAGAGDAGIEAIALAGSELSRARDDLPEGFESTAHALLDPLFVHVRETPAGRAAEDP